MPPVFCSESDELPSLFAGLGAIFGPGSVFSAPYGMKLKQESGSQYWNALPVFDSGSEGDKMKKRLTRVVFFLALAASAAFAVRYAPPDKATQLIAKDDVAKHNLDKTNNAKDNLDKGTPDSAKDNLDKSNLAKNGSDAKDNLSKGPCAKDNLGVGLL
jgi:hypothetical protein